MAKADASAVATAAAAQAVPGSNSAAPAPTFNLLAWLPVIATVLLAPVATWAVVEFVLLPRLQQQLSAPNAAVPAAEVAPAATKGGAPAEGDAGKRFEFNNVVVNLAGTMGTRYLKTSFVVTGVDAAARGVFEANKPRLTDVTLNVLSSLTLSDLEEPGAKNVIREKLVNAYNQALNKKVAEQVYFSDFVVQ